MAAILVGTIAIALLLASPGAIRSRPFIGSLAVLALALAVRTITRSVQRPASTRRRALEDALLVSSELRHALDASGDAVFVLKPVTGPNGVVRDFHLSDTNRAGASFLRSTREQLLGRALGETLRLSPTLRADTTAVDEFVSRCRDAFVNRAGFDHESRLDPRMFGSSWAAFAVVPGPHGVVITARDVRERKRQERRLLRASTTDELTGLNNRRGFLTMADQSLRIARRQGHDALLFYVDMDDFKALNDRFGHREGDRALTEVGRLLRAAVRDSDVVARLGGDEFTILALDASVTDARTMQKRIEQHVALLNGSGLLKGPIGFTIGYTRVRPTDSATVTELLARADALLYSRKRRRKAARASAAHAIARSDTVHVAAPRSRTRRTAVPFPAGVSSTANGFGAVSPMGSGIADDAPLQDTARAGKLDVA